ncbi:DUF2796 domain-containing protein [Piscinibacter koreensis]|uniref:DUF2796 domain-containing protein n=1 Tax=Piscinibacter koreensis TaxID=2742824 RepID=A0A7Y6NP47_9BURK|nr:DUF2796 domain-containing protein [Schlegelella koreensis]NUZ06686.1 DUF2796 domain-containing protein [Schlegelella koreensis]
MKPISAAAFLLALASAASLAGAASKPHEHGVVKLDVAVEGENLSVAMEAPLDIVLGFERAPRTDSERRAAADVLSRLREGAALFSPDAAAQCRRVRSDVRAGVLEAGARHPANTEHADLDATYEYRCAQPGSLRTLDVGLFDAFKRIQRVDVQVAGPGGQAKATLQRPARVINIRR